MSAIHRLSATILRLAPARLLPGQGLVEYSLALVLIAMIVIGIITSLGTQTSQVFDQTNCTLTGGAYHTDNGNGHSNRCR